MLREKQRLVLSFIPQQFHRLQPVHQHTLITTSFCLKKVNNTPAFQHDITQCRRERVVDQNVYRAKRFLRPLNEADAASAAGEDAVPALKLLHG